MNQTKRHFLFVSSKWMPEVFFQARTAKALAQRGHPCSVVTFGETFSQAYRDTGAFDTVYDLTTHTREGGFMDRTPTLEDLAKLEEKYGAPNLWQFLAADRFLTYRSYDDNLRFLMAHAAFWDQLMREAPPSLLVGEVSHFHNYFAWAVGQHHGVPYAHLTPARVPAHCAIGDGPYEHQKAVTERYHQYQQSGAPAASIEKAKVYIEEFAGRMGRAAHLERQATWWQSPNGSGTLNQWLKEIPAWYSPARRYDYHLVSPVTKLSTWLKQRARKMHGTLFGTFDALPQDETPFILFGLQLQPESSTLVRGAFAQDLLATARQLAMSLPAGYRLYVKEHDVMFGRRPFTFYQSLKDIPNIVLVSPYENGPQLVRQAAGVAVVTGTFGWDAILLGKPAIIMGQPFFAHYNGVHHVTDPTQLPQAMQERFVQQTIDLEDRTTFVAAVLDSLVPSSMDDLWGNRELGGGKDAEILAEALINFAQQASA